MNAPGFGWELLLQFALHGNLEVMLGGTVGLLNMPFVRCSKLSG